MEGLQIVGVYGVGWGWGVGGWSGQVVLGAPAGRCGTVGEEERRGEAGGGEAGGGGSGEEAGEGWAVVKARATPGNPASIQYMDIMNIDMIRR